MEEIRTLTQFTFAATGNRCEKRERLLIREKPSYKLRRVALAEIDSARDDTAFSPGRSLSCLIDSLRSAGQLAPIWLQPAGPNAWHVVCGHRRCAVARQLGWASLDAFCFDAPLEPAQSLLLNLLDNLSHRKFEPLEIGRVLSQFARHWSKDRVVEKILPLFGLKPRFELFENYTRLADLPASIQSALMEGRTNEKIAFRFHDFPKDEQEPLFALFQQLELSVSLQRETLEMIYEIAKREKIDFRRVREELVSYLRDQGKGSIVRAQADAARRWLHARRFPKLDAREQQFAADLAALDLPPEVALKPPPYFEGRQFSLEIQFRKADQLLFLLEKLSHLGDKKELLDRLIEGSKD
ncbi:MAG: ParB N-terminal domain-containing protein [bacterium]